MIGAKLVNRYQILERVGGGGMAVVYKARCTLLNRIVAVKVLRQQYASDEDFVRRFRREAQSAASLSHPNIVSIYDVGQDKDIYFIVMEYVEGETLKDLINREGPLESPRAVAITRQIANALFHAHNNKIIHRDIKPQNVLIAKDGRIKVADFGIARAVSTTTQTFSPNSIVGSVHYLSPEQAKGRLANEQSDIYSLGIVLYEMLTKELPFDGDSAVSIALKHLQDTIPPASEINSAVSSGIQSILDKMLEKDRSLRYQNICELLADLRNWNLVSSNIPLTSNEEPDEEGTQVFTPIVNKPALNRKQMLKRIGLIGGLALAAILVIVLGVIGIRNLGGFFRVDEVIVPDVTGLELDVAIAQLEALDLRYEITEVWHETIPENHVVLQDPGADRVVKVNRVIELTVSKGPDMIEIPNLEGQDLRAAISILEGLRLGYHEERETSETVPFNQVIRHSPVAGKVRRSTVVTLYVSNGPAPVNMINLVGKTLAEARDLIEQMRLVERLVVGNLGDSPGGIVTGQTPAMGEDVKPGDHVDLEIRPFIRRSIVVELGDLDPDESYAIEIAVKDITGATNSYNYTHTGASTFTATVQGWERGTFSVYLEGAKQRQEDF